MLWQNYFLYNWLLGIIKFYTNCVKGILLWNVLLGSISYLFFYNILLIINSFFMHDRGRKQRRELLVAKYCRSDCLTRSVRKNLLAGRQAAKKFQIARSLWYARRRAIRLLFLFPHCQLYELFFAPSLERGCCKSFGFAGWWLIKSAVNCRVTY